MIRLTLISFGFTLIGLWFIFFPPEGVHKIHGVRVALPVLGVVVVVFFGLMAVFMLRKVYNKRPAIIIDDLGIDDRSSLLPAGYIVWQDLKSVSILEMHGQKMIMLEVKNPEEHINKQSNILKRLLLRLNGKMFKGHFSISANSLDITTEELLRKLREKINQ